MERRFLIMPGYVTHYIFGREVYHNLKNNSLKKNLYYNRAAYGLGLQGPDIFFYYLPSYVLEVTISVLLPMSARPVPFSRV